MILIQGDGKYLGEIAAPLADMSEGQTAYIACRQKLKGAGQDQGPAEQPVPIPAVGVKMERRQERSAAGVPLGPERNVLVVVSGHEFLDRIL